MSTDDALQWIAELFEEPVEKLSLETPRDDVPAWDSLGTLTLMASLDEQFGINLTADQIADLRTVGDLAGILKDA